MSDVNHTLPESPELLGPEMPGFDQPRRARSPRTRAASEPARRAAAPGSARPARSRTTEPAHPRSSRARGSQLAELQRWLAGLGMAAVPSVHVNGPAHGQAVLVVDFGVPLNQPKLTQDQAGELAERMREATVQVLSRGGFSLRKRDGEAAGQSASAGIRVSSDHHNGIWWAALA
jgi:hypothetical protein